MGFFGNHPKGEVCQLAVTTWRVGKLEGATVSSSKGNPSSAGSKSGTSSHKQSSTLLSEHTDTDETSMHLHARETHDAEALETSIQELVLKKKSAKLQLRNVTEQQQVIMNDVFEMTMTASPLNAPTNKPTTRSCNQPTQLPP